MVLMIKSSFISAFCKTICTTQGGPGRMGARVPVLAQPTGTGFIAREVQKITFYTYRGGSSYSGHSSCQEKLHHSGFIKTHEKLH